MSFRDQLMNQWVANQFDLSEISLSAVSGDASFRRYFRAIHQEKPYIVMDAPPEHEDCRPFVAIVRDWLGYQVPVPQIVAEDLERGFLVLEDFGDVSLLEKLNADSAPLLYQKAMEELLKIQQVPSSGSYRYPPYDDALLLREMSLFPDWLMGEHLGIELSEAERVALEQTFGLLIDSALEQPQVCVHRDYHSRNLMLTESGNIGVIDFQDAVWGPVTYDLVSLLRDCYIKWPTEQCYDWVLSYKARIVEHGIINNVSDKDFIRWFDLMGVQRHLKASGIFARLLHRDGKDGYMNDVPRTLSYIMDVANGYPELSFLSMLIKHKILPALKVA